MTSALYVFKRILVPYWPQLLPRQWSKMPWTLPDPADSPPPTCPGPGFVPSSPAHPHPQACAGQPHPQKRPLPHAHRLPLPMDTPSPDLQGLPSPGLLGTAGGPSGSPRHARWSSVPSSPAGPRTAGGPGPQPRRSQTSPLLSWPMVFVCSLLGAAALSAVLGPRLTPRQVLPCPRPPGGGDGTCRTPWGPPFLCWGAPWILYLCHRTTHPHGQSSK